MMIAFSAQRMPKKMVHRVRFRSTSDPPPKELPPPPIPNAPERPASLPECRSTRKMRITDMMTSITLSTVAMSGSVGQPEPALIDLTRGDHVLSDPWGLARTVLLGRADSA